MRKQINSPHFHLVNEFNTALFREHKDSFDFHRSSLRRVSVGLGMKESTETGTRPPQTTMLGISWKI